MKTLAVPQIFRVLSAISRQNCIRYLLSATNERPVSEGAQMVVHSTRPLTDRFTTLTAKTQNFPSQADGTVQPQLCSHYQKILGSETGGDSGDL